MKPCIVCGAGALNLLIDFGPQALCNRFVSDPSQKEPLFDLTLGQCDACGLIQIISPVPPAELKPRFDWITYNEQEGHLDDMVAKICALPGVHPGVTVGAVCFKDDTTVARFQKRGFTSAWRLDPAADLEIADPMAGLETVQDALTPERAVSIASRRGKVNVLIVRHILEHSHQTTRFATALQQLVKPDGYLVFEVPDCQPALERRDYSMPWEEHIVYFTPDTFRRSLATLGFSEVNYQCYVYANENSLVGIVKTRGAPTAYKTSTGAEETQKALARNYAGAFAAYRNGARRELTRSRASHGPIAVFGAGHLSCFWVNALGLADCLEFVIDDHPKKRGLLMPGSKLPIRGSASLLDEKIKLCLLSLSPESEVKVVAKNQAFLAAGGTFASIFPGKVNSLAID